MLFPWKESYDNQDWTFKSRDITLLKKICFIKTMVFLVVMWDLDHKEGWVPKNWCFQIMVLDKTLEIPWRVIRSNQSIIKKINPEYSLEGLMLKAESPILWPSHVQNLTHWTIPWCWKDWGKWDKGVTEDEMVGWHHQLNGHEFEQTLGDR